MMITPTRQPARPRLTLTIAGADYDLTVRAFGDYELTKVGGDRPYPVSADQCDCEAFRFGKGKPCKHLEALMAVGLLPRPAPNSPEI